MIERRQERAPARAFVVPGRSARDAACVKGAANHAFVILGRSTREAAFASLRPPSPRWGEEKGGARWTPSVPRSSPSPPSSPAWW
ncbi:MAG: hypothetical protein E5W57_02740 [Mesorhizobium sp.]|nr:MAG: hypothetical protein E5W57_02740 [Mesorhizobium sp.]